MGITVTDTFGKALAGAIKGIGHKMDLATARSARIVQRNWVKGIETNDLAQNSIAPWPALSPKYAKFKEKHGGSDKMLIGPNRPQTDKTPAHDGGEYMRSIEVTTHGECVYETGTNLPYARRQEFGFPPVPARPSARPALEESTPEIIEEYRKAAQELFE